MLNDLFYAVLGMLPWTCALIAALSCAQSVSRNDLVVNSAVSITASATISIASSISCVWICCKFREC